MVECWGRNSFPNSWETDHSQGLLVPALLGDKGDLKVSLYLMELMLATVHIVPLALLNLYPVQHCPLTLWLAYREPASQSVGDAQIVCTCMVVEAANQLNMGQCTGGGVKSPHCVNQCPFGRLRSRPQGHMHQQSVAWHWLAHHIMWNLALLHFLPELRSHHVLEGTGSSVEAAYINRQRDLDSLCLCKLAQTIWEGLVCLPSLHRTVSSSTQRPGGRKEPLPSEPQLAPDNLVLNNCRPTLKMHLRVPCP